MTRLSAAELNVLAYAASYGGVKVDDFYTPPKYSAQLSKSQRLAWKKFNERTQALVNRGLLVEGLNEHRPTAEGIAFLKAEGCVREPTGIYLKPGARVPKWAF